MLTKAETVLVSTLLYDVNNLSMQIVSSDGTFLVAFTSKFFALSKTRLNIQWQHNFMTTLPIDVPQPKSKESQKVVSSPGSVQAQSDKNHI